MAVVSAAVVVLLAMGPRARRSLGLIAVYTIASTVLMSVGRPDFVAAGSTIPRYFADLAPVTAIALALATTTLVQDPAPDMLREWRPRPTARVLVPVAVLAQVVVLLWITSVVGLVGFMTSSKDRVWVEASLRSLRAAHGTSPILTQLVPASVMNPLLYPYNDYSWFFAGISGAPRFDTSTDRLRLLDDKGALVDAHVRGLTAPPGPIPECGYKVEPEGAWIPISKVVFPWAQTVQLAYISKYDTFVDVTFTQGETKTVRLAPGLHDVYFWLNGGGTAIHIKPSNPDEVLCIGAVRVGQPTAGAAPEVDAP